MPVCRHWNTKGAPDPARLKRIGDGVLDLLHCGPDALDVFVVFEGLEEIAHIFAVDIVEFGKTFGDVADFAGDDGPAMLPQPYGGGMDGGTICQQTEADVIGRYVVVLVMSDGFEFVGASLNGDGFEVAFGVGLVCFDDADVIKKKLVATASTERAPSK